MTDENWVTINDFPNYMLSSKGRVLNKKTAKLLSTPVHKHGYRCVRLWDSGKTKLLKIYRLVAIYFIPNPLNKREVNHKNGDYLNHDLDNLEWVTPSENMRHAVKNGFCAGQFKKGALTKLTPEDVYAIRIMHYLGILEPKSLSKQINVGWEHISRVGKRKTLSHV